MIALWRVWLFSFSASTTALAEDATAHVAKELLDTADECQHQPGNGEPECSLSALQRRGLKLGSSVPSWDADVVKTSIQAYECAPLWDEKNGKCRGVVEWSKNYGIHDQNAAQWYGQMQLITGVEYTSASATLGDWHRLYFCSPPGGVSCGLPPCECTRPPCNTCLAGLPPRPKHPGCYDGSDSIACKPPQRAMDYKGKEWPSIRVVEPGEGVHLFAIGDWGGMDGTLDPIEERPPVIAYSWGSQSGPSVFPRSRYNMDHSEKICSHTQFVECYETKGKPPCHEDCGYVDDVDGRAQLLVAEAFKKRAALVNPALVLNVGDNFYWGGIEKTCGTPMNQMSFTAWHQFSQIFEGIYQGEGLTGKPWLSVLGNHDWGGRQFNNGWDQQIAYTWQSDRWIMPAPYWMVKVQFTHQHFSADIFMLDTNFLDAREPSEDSEHNICGRKHNAPDADCSMADGPTSIDECPAFFERLWKEQKLWLENRLRSSTAEWQIVVTHFPCGEDGDHQRWYHKLHTSFGLDFLVTGHRHDQELWLPDMYWKNWMGGLTCIVTGGGGGISSEATPNSHDTKYWYGEAQYGFYDLYLTRTSLQISSINVTGEVVKTATVFPRW